VKNQALIVLHDSGSSYMFLNKALAQKLQLAISPIAPMAVKVANGASLSCSAKVRQFEWWIQGQTFQLDAKLLKIGAYDLVLGMDWLERFRPMTCDWLEKWIEFQYNGKLIRL
jgi:predicted aspartyl protease